MDPLSRRRRSGSARLIAGCHRAAPRGARDRVSHPPAPVRRRDAVLRIPAVAGRSPDPLPRRDPRAGGGGHPPGGRARRPAGLRLGGARARPPRIRGRPSRQAPSQPAPSPAPARGRAQQHLQLEPSGSRVACLRRSRGGGGGSGGGSGSGAGRELALQLRQPRLGRPGPAATRAWWGCHLAAGRGQGSLAGELAAGLDRRKHPARRRRARGGCGLLRSPPRG